MRNEIEATEQAGAILLKTGTIKDTELVQREIMETINNGDEDRKAIEAEDGQTWNSEELGRDFKVMGFAAPYCVVLRKADDKKGTIMFKHSPRIYFGFCEQ